METTAIVKAEKSADAVEITETPVATTKKPRIQHVATSLTPEQFWSFTASAVEKMKILGPGGVFNARAFAAEEKIKISHAKKVFLMASNMVDFHVKYSDDEIELGVEITDKFKLSLKKKDLENLNTKRDEGDQFAIGDTFEVSASGEAIILTRTKTSSRK